MEILFSINAFDTVKKRYISARFILFYFIFTQFYSLPRCWRELDRRWFLG